MVKRIDIVIAEPSLIIRSGVTSVFSKIPNFNTNIAEIKELSSFIEQLKDAIPDILVINPSYLGYISPNQLKTNIGSKKMKIVALQNTLIDNPTLKNFDETISIYDDIETITRKISTLVETHDQDLDTKKDLTSREKEIITFIVKGMSNKQIAEALFLSPHTVITHRRNIASKLQINSPAGLTIYAIVNKLVDLSEIK